MKMCQHTTNSPTAHFLVSPIVCTLSRSINQFSGCIFPDFPLLTLHRDTTTAPFDGRALLIHFRMRVTDPLAPPRDCERGFAKTGARLPVRKGRGALYFCRKSRCPAAGRGPPCHCARRSNIPHSFLCRSLSLSGQ